MFQGPGGTEPGPDGASEAAAGGRGRAVPGGSRGSDQYVLVKACLQGFGCKCENLKGKAR